MKLVFLLGISLTANMLLAVLEYATYSCWKDEMADNVRLHSEVSELKETLKEKRVVE